MTDIASLGFAVDTGGLVKGEASLNGLTNAARRAEAAAQGVASGSSAAGAASARAAAGVQAQATAMNALAASSKMAAFQQRNLVFQLNDVAVSLASGMNPLMVAAQQGSQIATIYSAQEGGVARAFQETGKMALWAAGSVGRLALAHPLATATALALGGALSGIVGDLQEAGHESIGYADVFVAAMQVAASGIHSVFKPAIDFLGPYIGAAWDWIGEKTKWLANGIVNSFSAGIKIVSAVFSNLPTIAGAAAIGAANAVIAAIESMVNGASSLLNSFIGGVNQVTAGIAAITGGEASKIGDIGKVSLGRLAGPDYGKMASDFAKVGLSLGDTFGADPVGDFMSAIKARAIANDQAEKDAKKRAGRKGGAGRAERTARDEEAEAIKRQAAAYDDLVVSQQRAIYAADLERESLGLSEEARRAVMLEQDLLNRAQDAGIKLTNDQAAALKGLAQEATAAQAALEKAKKAAQEQKDELQFYKDTTQGFFRGIYDGLREGMNLWQSFADAAITALDRIASRLMDKAISAIVDDLFTGGETGNGFLGSLLGFSSGGYTGNGAAHQVAGVVHGREFVVNAQNTERFRPALEAMNRGIDPRAFSQQGGGDVVVNLSSTINAPGANPTTLATMQQMLNVRDAQLRKEIPGLVSDARQRNKAQRAYA